MLRYFLHPAQQAVGYATVKPSWTMTLSRKKKAEATMKTSPLLYMLGPEKVPFLIDAHHTSRALEESGYDHTEVTFQMVCDWSSMSSDVFYDSMIKSNFMEPLGCTTNDFKENRPSYSDSKLHQVHKGRSMAILRCLVGT